MKKLKCGLCILLVLSLNISAFASVLGEPVGSTQTNLTGNMTLANGVFYISQSNEFRRENYIEYKPGGDSGIRPMVVYGSKVCNYGSFTSMAKLMENKGYHVIGGINADYYQLSSFAPLGIVVTDGILRSGSCGEQEFCAVGFYEDGTAVIGYPTVGVNLAFSNGQSYGVNLFNKVRADGPYLTLLSPDFANTTQNPSPGIDVILAPVEGDLRINGNELSLRVEEVRYSTGKITIPEGRYVITLSDLAKDGGCWETLSNLQAGSIVKVNATTWDTRWNNVVHAVGSYRRLVENGQVCSGLDEGNQPRTAVGVKADGSIILYTLDGRQPGYSIGASMTQLAQRLIELGCVDAALMDGGGSTSLNALYIGDSDTTLINSPSDGSPRSVTNYIMLVSTLPPTGVAKYSTISPANASLLAGAELSYSIRTADAAGYPATTQSLSYETSGNVGTVSNGVLTAGSESASGYVTVKGEGGTPAQAAVTVYKTPETLSVSEEASGKAVNTIALNPGETMNLTAASALYGERLISQDRCYTWSVVGDIGTIDESGLFSAGDKKGTGTIRVTAGELTVTIPVVVGLTRFDDISSQDWFYGSVQYTCAYGLFNGTGEATFSPELSTTRAMFVTLLGRLAGVNKDEYSSCPFPDVDMSENSYYGGYVSWAHEEDLVRGYDTGLFCPDDAITREELCVLVARYAEYTGVSLPESGAPVFSDWDSISPYAQEAVSVCAKIGLVNGRTNGSFDPLEKATRAEVSAILQRFLLLAS